MISISYKQVQLPEYEEKIKKNIRILYDNHNYLRKLTRALKFQFFTQ